MVKLSATFDWLPAPSVTEYASSRWTLNSFPAGTVPTNEK